MRFKVSLCLILMVLFSCEQKKEFSVKGKVSFQGKGVYDAEVQVYHKEEKDKEKPPVKVTATDEKGDFAISLPGGKYFLMARKRLEEGGEVQMLVSNYPQNPLTVSGETVLENWPLFSKRDKSEYNKGAGISGKVTGFKNDKKVRVYAYENTDSGLKGPDYAALGKIDKDGNFKIDLRAGKFFIAARERKEKNVGPLRDGDLSGEHPKNPVAVQETGYLDLGAVKLAPVDRDKVAVVNEKGLMEKGSCMIKGVVEDGAGKPVKSIYVLVYDNSEMVGRPAFISTPTKESGRFSMLLPKPGKYFVGARSRLGGPAEPGEKIGTYTGSYDKSVTVKPGAEVSIKIDVREVW